MSVRIARIRIPHDSEHHSICIREPPPAGDWPSWFELGVPAVETYGGAIHITLALPESVDFYGTGEQVGPLLRNGKTVRLWASDVPGYGPGNQSLYKAIPWVAGLLPDGRAIGVFADSTAPMRIYCGREGRAFLELDVGGESLDVVLFQGDSLAAVLEAYTALVGRAPLPPLWALGHHQCRYSYPTRARIEEIAHGFRDRDIPCDTLWIDIAYMQAYRSFTWDDTAYHDLPEMIRGLHDAGFSVVAILDPALKVDPDWEVYRQAVAEGHLVLDADGEVYQGTVWPGRSVYPDFTRDETRVWWSMLTQQFVEATGLDGLWVDMNEPSDLRSPTGTLPRDAQLAAGSHEQVHNSYGFWMAKATRRGLDEARPNQRPFVLTRSTFAGGQVDAAVWTGDNSATWHDLRQSIAMLLGLGLSGHPFCGADIGGFTGDATPELFARWVELGSLTPFCRIHTKTGTADHEPWSFGDEVEAVCRRALKRRMRLLPWLYTLFHEAMQTGAPVMRPLFWVDATNPALRGIDDAFSLGDDVVVAPVVEAGATSRDVTFPAGTWVHLEQEHCYAGTARVTAPLGSTPIFLRQGSMIPTDPDEPSTAPRNGFGAIEWWGAPDHHGQCRGRVYLDRGDGPADGRVIGAEWRNTALHLGDMHVNTHAFRDVSR